MFDSFIKAVFGTKNQRQIRRLQPLIDKINELEVQYQKLSDSELKDNTQRFKARYTKGETLDSLLPEAFATVKNACRRLSKAKHTCVIRGQSIVWEMVPFDVQLVGGIVLHSGKIAEMATGEGKTLVATLPAYLNALNGKGVHVVTVNDYLAARDSEWMGELYRFLGLTVGCIQNSMPPRDRAQAYSCDITYGTSSEMGFDYLRDNGTYMDKDEQVQRGHIFALVDEVDSILIDEARVPLIIAGPAATSSHQYDKFKGPIERLVQAQIEEANRWVADAKKLVETDNLEEAGRLLYKVKISTPRNRLFLRLMENPEVRRAVDAAELALYQDPRKSELYKLKAESYFNLDEKNNSSDLSERGREFLNPGDPKMFILPDLITAFHEIDQNAKLSPEEKQQAKIHAQEEYDTASERIHNIGQLLKAYCVFEKDKQYIIQEGKIVIVDENTNRPMPGRRWSDGLHQAVEAKEGVRIEQETQTLATITIQNYFRLYKKLAGMTGTAETEANEFHDIYKLDVVVIPTNRPVRRVDLDDSLFKTEKEKTKAIVREIKDAHALGQPILVGTASVEASERLSRLLRREGIVHNVLNARYIQQEAEIVAQAGQRGAVTIATNMAGRGTDIKLGAGVNEIPGLYIVDEQNRVIDRWRADSKVEPGQRRSSGLFVIGTERHESRRIDRQLRGRCARQGDPGISKCYISFEDDLMRHFGNSERMAKIMSTMGMADDEDVQSPLLNSVVANAQRQVEERNYMRRKHILQYDDVMNVQRSVVYTIRNEILHTDNPRSMIFDIVENTVSSEAKARLTAGDDYNPSAFISWLNLAFPLGVEEKDFDFSKGASVASAEAMKRVREAYDLKLKSEDPAAIERIERTVLLGSVDPLWKEHLLSMDHLRNSMSLRTIGQKDPVQEYKQEAFRLFESLMKRIEGTVCTSLFRTSSHVNAFMDFISKLSRTKEIHPTLSGMLPSDPMMGPPPELSPNQPAVKPVEVKEAKEGKESRHREDPRQEEKKAAAEAPRPKPLPIRHSGPSLNRNDPCPMGNGKKFKNCCGADGVSKQCMKQ